MIGGGIVVVHVGVSVMVTGTVVFLVVGTTV